MCVSGDKMTQLLPETTSRPRITPQAVLDTTFSVHEALVVTRELDNVVVGRAEQTDQTRHAALGIASVDRPVGEERHVDIRYRVEIEPPFDDQCLARRFLDGHRQHVR